MGLLEGYTNVLALQRMCFLAALSADFLDCAFATCVGFHEKGWKYLCLNNPTPAQHCKDVGTKSTGDEPHQFLSFFTVIVLLESTRHKYVHHFFLTPAGHTVDTASLAAPKGAIGGYPFLFFPHMRTRFTQSGRHEQAVRLQPRQSME